MASLAVQPTLVLLSDTAGGNPTQYMIEKAFAFHDLDWRYLTVEVAEDDLPDAVRGLRAMGFSGGHCSSLHQTTILPLLDEATEAAGRIGSVNFITRVENRLLGDNSQGAGVLAALRPMIDLAGKHVVLLGAQGVARAIAVALADAEIESLTVVDLDLARGQALLDLVGGGNQDEEVALKVNLVAWDGDFDVPADTNLLIHATGPIGDPEAQVAVNVNTLSSEMVVADLTADPPRTWLLREAKQRGCRTVDGLTMFIEQVARDILTWTGIDPNRDVLREAVEEFLEV